MKTRKMINTAFTYMLLGLFFGLFYREYTKYVGFKDPTTLSILHTHTLILGMFFFLIAALFENRYKLSHHKSFNKFYVTYNIGLVGTILLMLARGLVTIHVVDVSKALDASISGMAGLAHIIITFGMMYFFKALRDNVK